MVTNNNTNSIGAGFLLMAMTGGVGLVSAAEQMDGLGQRALALEEIVVTAQKRTQNLQDVPLSITAFDAVSLEKLGADDFVDYARMVPGLSFIDRGPGRNKIVIRGVSTGTDQNNQAPVGVYIDEMPVSAPSLQPDLKLFDVERVEVLRGPQGTLYGAGSMGGTIKVITAKPVLDSVSAKLDATASSTRYGDENYALNAMVNMPVIEDKFALRLVGYHRDESGYVDNVGLGESNVNDEETSGGRISARFQVNDRLSVTGMIIFQDTELGGTQETAPALSGLRQDRFVEEVREDDFQQYNITIEYDAGWADLLSSTSYYERDFREVRDITAFLGAGATVSLDNTVPIETFSQEIRLTSKSDDSLRWLVGAFYMDLSDDLEQLVPHGGVFGLPVTTPLLEATIENEQEQYALFGELYYDITDKLTATVGLRWFTVDQSFTKNSQGLIAGGNPPPTGGDSDESKVNPKFVLDYHLTENVMLFAQAAEGFRVGGPNSTIPDDPITGQPAPDDYSSDSLWSYEIGAKTSWFDNRLTLNAAIYYIDWTDIQISIPRADGYSYTDNAGRASSQGVEFELTTRPFTGLKLTLSGSYTEAELEKDAVSLGGEKGDRIPAVPRVNFSASARYEFAVSEQLDGFAQFDYQYVGDSYNGFDTAVSDKQHAYELGNLRVGVARDTWEVSLFANNIWDEKAELFVDTLLGDKRVNINRPRTIGLNLRKLF